jgi:hypothetical protein
MTVSDNDGLFFWHDHRSSNPEAAKAFYTALLGWNIKTYPMGDFSYEMVDVESVPFGGVVGLMPGEEGTPAHWATYLGTPDVDTTTAAVAENGGEVKVPPMDIPTVGRFSVVTDPTGAYVMPMTVLEPSQVDLTKTEAVGAPSWNELYTSDVDAAVAFYTKLFGHGVQVAPMEGMPPYTMLTVNDIPVAGIFPKPQEMPMSAWGVYFRVADADAAAAKIVELGGQVIMPPMDVPMAGRIASAIDSTGAYFSIRQITE